MVYLIAKDRIRLSATKFESIEDAKNAIKELKNNLIDWLKFDIILEKDFPDYQKIYNLPVFNE